MVRRAPIRCRSLVTQWASCAPLTDPVVDARRGLWIAEELRRRSPEGEPERSDRGHPEQNYPRPSWRSRSDTSRWASRIASMRWCTTVARSSHCASVGRDGIVGPPDPRHPRRQRLDPRRSSGQGDQPVGADGHRLACQEHQLTIERSGERLDLDREVVDGRGGATMTGRRDRGAHRVDRGSQSAVEHGRAGGRAHPANRCTDAVTTAHLVGATKQHDAGDHEHGEQEGDRGRRSRGCPPGTPRRRP